jgi:hypothetical protein
MTLATQLSPKHWRALELIEEGNLSIKEIAKTVGWTPRTLYDLYEGNTQKTGPIGDLFTSELNKIQARNASKVKYLVKENKKLALIKMNEYLRVLQSKRPGKRVTEEINKVLLALAKATPNVEIGSFSYTKGLSAEDLVNEFKRLNAVAQSALVGRPVSGALPGRSGVLPEPSPGGSPAEEE